MKVGGFGMMPFDAVLCLSIARLLWLKIECSFLCQFNQFNSGGLSFRVLLLRKRADKIRIARVRFLSGPTECGIFLPKLGYFFLKGLDLRE